PPSVPSGLPPTARPFAISFPHSRSNSPQLCLDKHAVCMLHTGCLYVKEGETLDGSSRDTVPRPACGVRGVLRRRLADRSYRGRALLRALERAPHGGCGSDPAILARC